MLKKLKNLYMIYKKAIGGGGGSKITMLLGNETLILKSMVFFMKLKTADWYKNPFFKKIK